MTVLMDSRKMTFHQRKARGLAYEVEVSRRVFIIVGKVRVHECETLALKGRVR